MIAWYEIPFERNNIRNLANALHLREVLITSSLKRGYKTVEEIRNFLFPHISNIETLKKQPDLDCFFNFFDDLISGKKRVLIWGHHDMDGVGSSYIIHRLLLYYGITAEVYIPHKKESYGVNSEVVKQYNVDYLIVVDNGMSSYEDISYLLNSSLRVVIIDHHEPSVKIPPCPILNPKIGDVFRFKGLCAAGLSLKFLIEYLLHRGLTIEKIISSFKDCFVVATMATFSDKVPLKEDNRIIAKYGMKLFKESGDFPFFKIMIDELEGNLVNKDYMEKVNPQIYALSPLESVELLISNDEERVKDLYKKAKIVSEEWKKTRETIMNNIKDKIEGDNLLFVIDESLDEKFIGTIANRIKKEYSRPVIVVGKKSSGVWSGEARADKGFDILSILQKNGDIFMSYGGHKEACGFSIEERNIPFLKERLKKISKEIKWNGVHGKIIIDGILKVEDLDRDILLLAPFGEMNPEPYFYCPEKKVLYTIDEKLNVSFLT